jgi:hypothetical protein
MRARERELVWERGRASLRDRAIASDFHVRERAALLERSCSVLVYLSSSSRYASPLPTAASDLSIPRQRSPVIQRTKPGVGVASLARDSMPTTLFVKRGFRLLRDARFVRCVREGLEVEAGDR